MTVRLSEVKAEEMTTRHDLEEQRLAIATEATRAQLSASRLKIDQLRAARALKERQVAHLRVKAGVTGVLQQIPVEVGQEVTRGQNLARVADPRTLKAELRVPETEARDIQVGQPARIDTHNGVAAGTVGRIDPTVKNGTVTVDVVLGKPLPRGSRPDLSVDGTVEIERLDRILHVGRPAFAQEGAPATLFRLAADGKSAERVAVRFGRTSVTAVEILSGLKEGDRVILSDMSAQDGIKHIALR
jgi:HlyD family secretion protein